MCEILFKSLVAFPLNSEMPACVVRHVRWAFTSVEEGQGGAMAGRNYWMEGRGARVRGDKGWQKSSPSFKLEMSTTYWKKNF